MLYKQAEMPMIGVFLRRSLPLLFAILLSAGFSVQAGLAQSQPPQDPNCVECHQEQYLLFDRGKWYCLNETSAGCTDCHAGQADTNDQKLAHSGLIANPTVQEAAICQKCHPDDYGARVEKFSALAGLRATPQPYVSPTPAGSGPISSSGSHPRPPRLRSLPPGPWQTAGLSLLGLGFLAVYLFGRRCWRLDRRLHAG